MNKQAVVIRHLAFEDLGILAPLLADAGYSITYYEAGVQPFDRQIVDADLLVVLGGPIGVNDVADYPWLAQEMDWIRQRLQQQKRTIGICLGAQLMAAAMGGQVVSGTRMELGWSALTLKGDALVALENLPVLHWHGDNIVAPQEAEVLASTEYCPVQAFSLGDYALGLQFHLEVQAEQFERWLVGHTGDLRRQGVDIPKLRNETLVHCRNLSAAAQAVFTAWI